MKYKLYYEFADVRKYLPASIEIHYDFNVSGYGLLRYTIIEEDLATFIRLVTPTFIYICKLNEV